MKEIAGERDDIKSLINLDISKDDVAAILRKSGFIGYRFDGALDWIGKAIEMIKAL